jgi:hypothetical protein
MQIFAEPKNYQSYRALLFADDKKETLSIKINVKACFARACKNGDLEFARALIGEIDARNIDYALMDAVCCGKNLDLIKMITDHKDCHNIDAESMLRYAFYSKDAEIVKYIVHYYKDRFVASPVYHNSDDNNFAASLLIRNITKRAARNAQCLASSPEKLGDSQILEDALAFGDIGVIILAINAVYVPGEPLFDGINCVHYKNNVVNNAPLHKQFILKNVCRSNNIEAVKFVIDTYDILPEHVDKDVVFTVYSKCGVELCNFIRDFGNVTTLSTPLVNIVLKRGDVELIKSIISHIKSTHMDTLKLICDEEVFRVVKHLLPETEKKIGALRCMFRSARNIEDISDMMKSHSEMALKTFVVPALKSGNLDVFKLLYDQLVKDADLITAICNHGNADVINLVVRSRQQ